MVRGVSSYSGLTEARSPRPPRARGTFDEHENRKTMAVNEIRGGPRVACMWSLKWSISDQVWDYLAAIVVSLFLSSKCDSYPRFGGVSLC